MNDRLDIDCCRDTWAEVSLQAIAYNSLQFKQRLGPNTKLMAVVKADGYGHGAVEAAAILLKSGADYLAVAFLDEALQLRDAGVIAPILVLGCTPIRSIRQAIMNDIAMTVYNREAIDETIVQASDLMLTAIIHLKIDTGMSRLGVRTREEALALAKPAQRHPYVWLEGVFTHFSNADEEDESYTFQQFGRFRSITDYLEEQGIPIALKHCCNSAGTMRFPQMHLDMVRVGIALYGLYPSEYMKNRHGGIRLVQAMSLKTRITSLERISASQPVSRACCSYRPTPEAVIATLDIGWADGLFLWLSKVETVAIHGMKVPIAGKIGRDQTIVNVTAVVTGCEAGDEVVVIGDGLAPLNVNIDDIARLAGTINYEVVCTIGSRVPRRYH
ncbi:alanine racemase [Paenibacillus mendelii]|uniref:Alanine racemase n=1 Tax=Paenibacillus mendelii TaxID=206163 RepID=A0ABV6J732_9BACL|nr:alanine racemase [Paenibacillus mendelii]MCQ6561039.1 alanine racemase [Paenibacillus mendelii]